jgi:hypothetical protein
MAGSFFLLKSGRSSRSPALGMSGVAARSLRKMYLDIYLEPVSWYIDTLELM